MKRQKSTLAAVLAASLLVAAPLPDALAADGSGSDYAFNEMISDMAGEDTGSQWFNYYVESINQEIAAKESEEPFGAAGPAGPLTGFSGYISGFTSPDTGSRWFDAYVDNLNRVLRAKEQ